MWATVIVILVAQSHLSFCDPMGCSSLGSSAYVTTRQEHWSVRPFPTSGYLPDPGMELASFAFPVLAGRLFTIKHSTITWEDLILAIFVTHI